MPSDLTDQNHAEPIRWAPRLSPHLLRRLYECDATGLHDQDLMDDVAMTLLVRCESIRRVSHRLCWKCGGPLLGERTHGSVLQCQDCHRSVPWTTYQRSYKGKRVHGIRAMPILQTFTDAYPKAGTWATKMLAIDTLVHGVHESLKPGQTPCTVPLAENLIEGTAQETFELLESLAAADTSTPGLQATRAAWTSKLQDYRRRLTKR
jgi:hypothetical protein